MEVLSYSDNELRTFIDKVALGENPYNRPAYEFVSAGHLARHLLCFFSRSGNFGKVTARPFDHAGLNGLVVEIIVKGENIPDYVLNIVDYFNHRSPFSIGVTCLDNIA